MDAISKAFGKLFQGFADSWLADAIGWWIGLLYGWTSGLVNFLATWWMGLQPLAIGDGSATDRVVSSTSFLVPIVGLISTIFAVARAGKAESDAGAETTQITTGLMRLLFVSVAGVTGTYMCMQFSSALAPWFFDVITAGAGDDRKLMSEAVVGEGTDFLASLSGAGYFFALPIMLVASLVQAGMAVGTDVGAAILSAVLPITAASSVTPKGQEAFAKQVGWIISCVSFKPVSAIIYGFGVALINGSNLVPAMVEDDSAGPFLSVLIGTMTLILAACALPALVKLIHPSPSILGSGGSRFLAAAGGAAIGAAITTLRLSGGTVTGSSGGQSSGQNASGAPITSKVADSSGGAAGGFAGGALFLAQAASNGVSKLKEGIQKGAAAIAEGITGARQDESNPSSPTQDGSSSSSDTNLDSSGGAEISSPTGANENSTESSGTESGTSSPIGANENSTESTSPIGATDDQVSGAGNTGTLPYKSSAPKPSGAPAKTQSSSKAPSGAGAHLENQIQHLIRAAGDEAESMITPEGAEQ